MGIIGTERLFLAAGIRDGFGTESLSQQDEAQKQKAGREQILGPGLEPRTAKNSLNFKDKDWHYRMLVRMKMSGLRVWEYFHQSKVVSLYAYHIPK